MIIAGAGERTEKLVLYIAIYRGQSPLSIISQLMHLCWVFIFCLKLQQAVSWVGGFSGECREQNKDFYSHTSFFIFQYYSFQNPEQPVKLFTTAQKFTSIFPLMISLFAQSG